MAILGQLFPHTKVGWIEPSAHSCSVLRGGAAQLRLSWVYRIPPQRKRWISPVIFRVQEAAVPCSVFLCWGRVWHCWNRTNCPLFPQVSAQAGGWGGWQCKNWDDAAIVHFPGLVFAFCVMQDDCNWEYLCNELPLWLSNMSALLFMFICRVCNSYKLLLHDRVLHLNFSLLNSSLSFIFLTA